MGLINNEKLYPKDKRITINDEVIGSDKDNNGVTRNYPMSNIVSLINEVNDLKFSLYIYSNDDANVRKGVFNINGVNFTFSNLDQESNDNTSLFNVIKNSKENIIIIIKDGAQTFGYYHVKNVTTNTESSTFELELINNIKAGNYVLENDYVFNINITTSTFSQVKSDWNESNPLSAKFIDNKPVLAPANAEENVQADWNQASASDDSFIKNKPVIPTKYTDEEVRDVVGTTLVAGSNVTITPNDSANTITIAATSSGGGSGTTDLSYVPSTRTIESSSGNNAVLPFSSAATPGLMKSNFYEEGVFTPSMLDGVSGSATYNASIAEGTYIRIGNNVEFSLRLLSITTTGGSPTGIFFVSNLPFTQVTGGYSSLNIGNFGGIDKNFYSMISYLQGGNITFIYKNNLDGDVRLQLEGVTFAGAFASVVLSGSYKTNVYTH